MNPYRILSALLQYPEAELLAALPELRAALAECPPLVSQAVAPLLAEWSDLSLIELQTRYVDLFDRQRSLSLHLFEHVYGESRERGPAMVSLMEEYHRHDFFIVADELPDYLPLFLEFLGQLPLDEADRLLGEAIHVVVRIGERLAGAGSLYSGVFVALRTLTSTEPLPVADPPVRDMDEAMETFGVGFDGVEPLLGSTGAGQPIQFYPRAARQGA
jgi:nitrate reductase molybdenum cofactor assembly chaperone NarJ/NarW